MSNYRPLTKAELIDADVTAFANRLHAENANRKRGDVCFNFGLGYYLGLTRPEYSWPVAAAVAGGVALLSYALIRGIDALILRGKVKRYRAGMEEVYRLYTRVA